MQKLKISKTIIDRIVELSSEVTRTSKRYLASTPPAVIKMANPSIAEDDLALFGLIESLPREELEELAAIIWIGRDFDGWTFDEALAEAKQSYQSPGIHTLYLLAQTGT